MNTKSSKRAATSHSVPFNGVGKINRSELILMIVFVGNRFLRNCYSLNNNLAFTPPMGWSSWGRFRCNVDCDNFPDDCISENLYRRIADKMVEDGYLKAGYQFLLMDDCWLAPDRDEEGRLQPDPKRFPSGLKNLSQYIHSKGLRFGIYENYGKYTCEGYPGIRDYTMYIDSSMFAYWEVDYVKLDGCYCDPLDMDHGYSSFRWYLINTGRPIVYSCSWPFYQTAIGMSPNYSAIADNCNLWRNYADIEDSWESVRDIVNYYGSHQTEFAQYGGPQHWNDPDSLIIGNFGLSYEQAKTQMAIWAVLAAPLIMSHDLRDVRHEFREILLNPRIIEVNQDPLGVQGKRIYINRRKKCEVWMKPVIPLKSGCTSWAIVLLNFDDTGEPTRFSFPLKYSKLEKPYSMYKFIDLFDPATEISVPTAGKLNVRIPPLGSRMIKAFIYEEEGGH